ncbi:hypothetical protein KDA14_03120, partial [Candidatus Saccharibacteria bacterium]|nr:hypothetical protein [Candidatus Saccharibacteria bacterium]
VSDPVALADVLAKSPAAKALKEKIPAPATRNETEYYVPQSLPDDIQCDYCDDIERILSARRKLATKLAQHLAKADTNLKVEAALIRAADILTPLQPVACEPTLQPLIDQSERIAVDKAVEKLLPAGFSSGETGVRMLDVRPRNELELVPYMLYESLDLPLVELKHLVDGWSYEVKSTIFESYLTAYPQGKALANASYGFDCFTDMQAVTTLPDELRGSLSLQQLTPRYGYDMPKEVEEAELTDDYDAIFDMSLQLQSSLQARRFQSEAQYATLLGHKQRWHVRTTALALKSEGGNASLQQMRTQTAEAHSLIMNNERST